MTPIFRKVFISMCERKKNKPNAIARFGPIEIEISRRFYVQNIFCNKAAIINRDDDQSKWNLLRDTVWLWGRKILYIPHSTLEWWLFRRIKAVRGHFASLPITIRKFFYIFFCVCRMIFTIFTLHSNVNRQDFFCFWKIFLRMQSTA